MNPNPCFCFHFEALHFEDQQRIFWHFRQDFPPKGNIGQTANRKDLYSLYSHEDIRAVRKLSYLTALYAHGIIYYEYRIDIVKGLPVPKWEWYKNPLFHQVNYYREEYYELTPVHKASYWFIFSYFGLMDLVPIFLKYNFSLRPE